MICFKNVRNLRYSAKNGFLQTALSFLLFSFSSYIHGQGTIKPFIKTAGALSNYDRSYVITADVSLAAGVHFNDHLSLQLGVNNIKKIYGQLDIVTLYLSPFYRILKSNHAISPVIGVDLGTPIWSNGNGRFIRPGHGFSFTSYDPESDAMYGYNTRYGRGLFFGKVKLLTDFKVNSFNIMVGPTFNIMYIEIERVTKTNFIGAEDEYLILEQNANRYLGFGGELSLMYTFPMKKRQAKKNGVGE